MKLRASELRDMTVEELKRRLRELQEEYFNLRFQKAIKLVQNPHRIREIKREIAQIKTVLNENRLGIRKLPG